ncbi:MAG: hypothetical protein DRP66_11415 [Planctomycetota bacterium]|nr:MAG: hypothetical protein DRP66_11415 [Planctomycetota bacterium]
MHFAVIGILLVLLNIHLGLFLLSGALAKTLCLSLAPLMHHLGDQWQNRGYGNPGDLFGGKKKE